MDPLSLGPQVEKIRRKKNQKTVEKFDVKTKTKKQRP